ncbi:putative phosphoenolpyruvate synthase [Actinoplanes philippinensis]|uniref:Pyruvate, water dikinase n=1 Tax=Actinoplanes philippinensis TaxID=35752 RepID=A0A1I2EHC1_9ACTN|nr:rifamycin-inactivating phosphotransferase [Actinoplanes philippinensis]GIE77003.1 putative phosphoenolpyruvate synthase [Actinoplanes philippinensis]SFE92037.1 pyruvate, water dikinase [Actinoplanes philippinensis]
MTRYVMNLDEIDRDQVAIAGGKGAHLGQLLRIDGVRVPPGFVVTTAAFDRVAPAFEKGLAPDDPVVPPDDLAAAIHDAIAPGHTYAVRSSATAEDSATASFAGQHDTFLNVPADAVPVHVARCWASLFTDRAVAYRQRNGIDHGAVRMAVVVQRMIFPRASGIVFTADPVTGNRRITSIDAGFGLGEALVSGLVDADVYKVRDGEIITREIATKRLRITPTPGGGTAPEAIAAGQQHLPVLNDAEIVRLNELARRLEAHFGTPQDIEWCLDDDGFAIVQSRPITTLFPVPEAPDDNPRVYVSVGHQQMMTEAMKPLGLSVWKLTSPGHMHDAGGRLFVDVTGRVGPGLLAAMTKSDPLMGDALRSVVDSGFVPLADDGGRPPVPGPSAAEAPPNDPAVVAELVEHRRSMLAALERDIATKSGPELLDFVLADVQEIRQMLFDPRNMPAIMAGMEATWWLNEHLEEWLGEKNAADVLTRSAPGNVTSEMGMALLDVADVLRAYPQVVDLLEEGRGLDRLPEVTGGREAREAIQGFLDVYGARCVGEIDITRPRWSEEPAAIVPMLLSNIRNAEPGEAARRFEQGRREALGKETELLARLRELPGGEARAAETKQQIDRLRTFIGYREFPKYYLVNRYFIYKRALLAEAGRLAAAGVIDEPEDVYFLTLPEFRDVVHTAHADRELIRQRREDFAGYATLTAPRVLTSDGEAVHGAYRRGDLPPGALAGLPVSAGTVEGRARVVLDVADAGLEPGDILVTTSTDPSWTPAFVTIAGLVTEVGGQMTHGAVIAREYGLPAVVGVENATTLIEDGARIRIHGTDGFVEFV